MRGELVMEIIKTNFGLEISNKIECCENEILVYLNDGTMAKIKTRKI